MKAILLHDFGGVENLEASDIPVPAIREGEVLIQVKAISINPVDLKIRQGVKMVGREKDRLPLLLGWDLSGTIAEVGKSVKNFKIGDEVFAMINYPGLGNTYAEFVVADPSQLALKPASIGFDAAAAATLSALTAWQALTIYGEVRKGDKVLIHAASGGVGHFAVQMAKSLGAYVIGTSSADNRDFVLSLGADEHIDYRKTKVEDMVSNLDFILDPLGGANTVNALAMARKGGSVVSIVFGFTEELFQIAAEREINAFNPQVRPSGGNMKQIADLLKNGAVRSHIGRSFSFDEMASAHLLLESGRSVGKIILNF